MAVFAAFQVAAIENVVAHAGPMLEEQGLRDAPVAGVAASGLVGVASDGRDVASLLTLPDVTDDAFDRIVATQLQDVGRQAASVVMATQPAVTSYTRALNLPSCGRCVVLAGKVTGRSVAFSRHPRCDCIVVPTNTAVGSRLVTDPGEAFRLMSSAERDRAFTKAGAEAIGLGADAGQVVNARRGMSAAQSGRMVRGDVAGQQLYATSAGVTRGGRRVRLMPESIAEIASGRDDQLRLLRVHGYIT